MSEMLRTQEAAEYLGIAVSYLHKLSKQKKIPYYKPFGKLKFYRIEDLDAVKKRLSEKISAPAPGEPNAGKTDLQGIKTAELLAEICKRGYRGTLTRKDVTRTEAYDLTKEYVITLK